MIFKNWKSKSELKREAAKKEIDIKHLNNRNVIADDITDVQLDMIDRLRKENKELCTARLYISFFIPSSFNFTNFSLRQVQMSEMILRSVKNNGLRKGCYNATA